MALIKKATFAGTKTWANTESWVGAKVPEAGDDVEFPNTEGSIEIAVAAKCRSLDCTEFKGTLSMKGVALTIGTTTANEGAFALKLGAGMTLTVLSTSKFTFSSSSATVLGIFTKGIKVPKLVFTLAGKWKLEDKLEGAEANTELEHTKGNLNFNNQNVTIGKLEFEGNQTRSVELGSGTIKLTGTSGNVINFAGEKLTITAGTSNIELTGTGATTKTIKGASLVVWTLTIAAEAVQVTGGIGIETLNLNTSGFATHTKIEATSILTLGKLKTNGKLGALVGLFCITAESTWTTIAKGEILSTDFIELQGSHGFTSGGHKFYAGLHSPALTSDKGQNENWTFGEGPHEHTLTVDQPQTLAQVKAPTKVMAVSQAQTITRSETMTRRLSVSQAQTSTLTGSKAHTLTASQGQSISKTTSLARTLTTTQVVSCSIVKTISRVFPLISQTQASVRTGAISRTLPTISQSQSITRSAALSRALAISQGSSPSLARSVSRTLAAEQAQAVVRAMALTRLLSVSQGQSVTQQHGHSISGLFTISQPQAPSLRRSLTRSLSAAQPQAVALARSPTRSLSISQGESASVARAFARSLTVSQGQSTSLRRALLRALTSVAPSSSSISGAISRTLTVSQPQTILLIGEALHPITELIPIRLTSTVTVEGMTSVAESSGQASTIEAPYAAVSSVE